LQQLFIRAIWSRRGIIGGMLAAYNVPSGCQAEYLTSGRERSAGTRDYVTMLVSLLVGELLVLGAFPSR